MGECWNFIFVLIFFSIYFVLSARSLDLDDLHGYYENRISYDAVIVTLIVCLLIALIVTIILFKRIKIKKEKTVKFCYGQRHINTDTASCSVSIKENNSDECTKQYIDTNAVIC